MYSYLFSSDSAPAERFFQGYAFAGVDYIFGPDGLRRYEAETGAELLGGEDGCYVLAKAQPGYHAFEADYAGYKRILFYHGPGHWVASNSLRRMVAHLRESGRRVAPNRAQLARMSSLKNITNQQTSFQTIVEGIRVLPAGCRLSINRDGFRVDARRTPANLGAYEDRLATFLRIWIARLRTLLGDKRMRIVTELSGGLDSRVVFALRERARAADGPSPAQLAVASKATRGDVDSDLCVAAEIADQFGVPLNAPIHRPKRLPADMSYRLWRDLDLGLYDLVFFPDHEIDPFFVMLGGCGGENVRRFYAGHMKRNTVEEFLRYASRNVRPASEVPAFVAQMQDAMSTIEGLEASSDVYVDPLIAYYRHFRGRFHGGRRSQVAVSFNPFASRHLAVCLRAAGQERLDRAQIHYDLLYATCACLLSAPFDDPKKAPSDEVRRTLALVHVGDPLPTGGIFAGACGCDDPGVASKLRPIDHASAEFDAALGGAQAASLFGDEFVREARSAMEAAVDQRGFEHPKNGKAVAAVLAAAFFD